jgi:hypothetical protein
LEISPYIREESNFIVYYLQIFEFIIHLLHKPTVNCKQVKPSKKCNTKNEILKEKMNFPSELFDQLDENTKNCLLEVYLSKPQLTEDDPLLLIVPDYNDANSIAFLNNGNYGLGVNQPGYLPWPGAILLFLSSYYKFF